MTHKPSYYCVFSSHQPVITSVAALGHPILSHKEPFVSGQKIKNEKNTLPAVPLGPELDGKQKIIFCTVEMVKEHPGVQQSHLRFLFTDERNGASLVLKKK